MSIALQNRINELERRIAILEAREIINAPVKESDDQIKTLWGEIKALKMRLGKKDSS